MNFYISEEDLADRVLITGFHGLGATGYIAVKHMVSNLKSARVGHIETERLPPFVSVEDGRLTTPFEIFTQGRLLFILTEVPPHPRDRHVFSRSVAEWAVQNRMREAILLGGLDNRLKKPEDPDSKCAMTEAFKTREEGANVPQLDKGLYVVGPLATMLAYFEYHNFPAMALLPYADPVRPDPRAAAAAIEFLNKRYQLQVDVSQLFKDAEKIEVEVKDLLRRRQERLKREQQALYI